MGKTIVCIIVSFFALSLTFFTKRVEATPFFPDLTYTADTDYEVRVDLDGNGKYDSYWKLGPGCNINLYNLENNQKRWTTSIPDCENPQFGIPTLIFHTKSFMGDNNRDFSIVIYGGGKNYWLYVGDGATGVLRDFKIPMGHAQREGVLRLSGIQVVDFQLSEYPGQSLFVRTTSDGWHGYLYYFPSNNNSYIDLTNQLYGSPAFAGADLYPGWKFGELYNAFNEEKCIPLVEWGGAEGMCGLPDQTGKGDGFFLDQISVADMDLDGVEDVLMTYMWYDAVYPARPKGRIEFLGAPQWTQYYSPQNDGTTCHQGRHYGITAVERIEGWPYPATINIGGLSVDQFSNPYQNVSRNIAVIRTVRHPTLATLRRESAWNIPMSTSIPGCGFGNTNGNTKLYESAIHNIGDSLLRDTNGNVRFIHFNRFTQAKNLSSCENQGIDCYMQTLKEVEGYWSYQIVDVKTGIIVQTFRNLYVWDYIPTGGDSVWIVYSRNANSWNIGTNDIQMWSTNHQYRDDLTIARLSGSPPQFSQVQNFPIKAKPFMKYIAKQMFNRNISSSNANSREGRLFTFVTADNMPGFVVRTGDGPVVFTFNGSAWQLLATTNTPTSIPTIILSPTITSTQVRCIRKVHGDANCDGKVDGLDYSLWLNTQCHKAANQTCARVDADFTGDGNTDDEDYRVWFLYRD